MGDVNVHILVFPPKINDLNLVTQHSPHVAMATTLERADRFTAPPSSAQRCGHSNPKWRWSDQIKTKVYDGHKKPTLSQAWLF